MTEVGEGFLSVQNEADICQCKCEGHPIDVATGKVFTVAMDVRFASPFPIGLYRNWQSIRADIPGTISADSFH